VHGSFGVHYELHEVATGRRVDEFTPAVDADGRSVTPAHPPKWVTELDAARNSLQPGSQVSRWRFGLARD
jgi:hypothetical protein